MVCAITFYDNLIVVSDFLFVFVSQRKSDEPILDNSQVNSGQGILVKKAKSKKVIQIKSE